MRVRPFICCASSFAILASFAIANHANGQAVSGNLGSGSFSVDAEVSTGFWSQTQAGLVISGAINDADSVAGVFNEPQNWDAVASTGLPVMISLTGSNPLLPFAITLFDSAFNSVATFEGTTAGLSASPGVILVPASSISGNLSNVIGFQFVWLGSAFASTITIHHIGPLLSPSFWTYTLDASNEATITGYSGPSGAVVIPDRVDGNSVTSIGSNAFYNLTGLTSVSIPDSVTSVGGLAFSGCTGLTSVSIGSGVTTIGLAAFRNCTGLTGFSVDPANPAFASVDDVLLNKALTSIIAFPAKKAGAYTIPDGVTSIGNGMFSNCTGLTSVSIPDSVTNLGWGAFSGCSSLTSVNIPGGVTVIRSFAFSGCASLTSVNIPDGVTSIESAAFDDCTSLTSVTIPDSVTSVGSNAFYNCTSLTTITMPSSVTSIGSGAFSSCSALLNVYLSPHFKDNFTSFGLSAEQVTIAMSPSELNAWLSDSESAGVAKVTGNPSAYSLYTFDSIMDLRMGGVIVQKQGSNAVVTFQPQITTDLANQPFVNHGAPITNTIPMPGNKGFLRIQAR
jgi:hypothetical protein